MCEGEEGEEEEMRVHQSGNSASEYTLTHVYRSDWLIVLWFCFNYDTHLKKLTTMKTYDFLACIDD